MNGPNKDLELTIDLLRGAASHTDLAVKRHLVSDAITLLERVYGTLTTEVSNDSVD